MSGKDCDTKCDGDNLYAVFDIRPVSGNGTLGKSCEEICIPYINTAMTATTLMPTRLHGLPSRAVSQTAGKAKTMLLVNGVKKINEKDAKNNIRDLCCYNLPEYENIKAVKETALFFWTSLNEVANTHENCVFWLECVSTDAFIKIDA